MNNYLVNQDFSTSGSFRGILLYDGIEARVFIPGISSINIFNTDGTIDNTKYQSKKNMFPIALFSSFEMKRTAITEPAPCWVVFENGDMKRPIIMGYFGKGIRNIGGTISDNDGNTNSGAPSAGGDNNIVPGNGAGGGSGIVNDGTVDMSNWIFPLKHNALYPIAGASRHFGAGRKSNGVLVRLHAGVDLYTKHGNKGIENDKVYACTSGEIIDHNFGFYEKTGQITIKNDDGTVIRYGETTIKDGLSNGKKVRQGEEIGYTPTNSSGNAMIHFEVYAGTATGALSDTSNSTYDYVSSFITGSIHFQRRRDLCNPTNITNTPIK